MASKTELGSKDLSLRFILTNELLKLNGLVSDRKPKIRVGSIYIFNLTMQAHHTSSTLSVVTGLFPP